jgi:hypothetical protein
MGTLAFRLSSPAFVDGYNIGTDVISHAMNPLPLFYFGSSGMSRTGKRLSESGRI